MTDRFLVDTGPLIPLFAPVDSENQHCAEFTKSSTARPLISWSVLTETARLSRRGVRTMFTLLRDSAEVVTLNCPLPGAAGWLRRRGRVLRNAAS